MLLQSWKVFQNLFITIWKKHFHWDPQKQTATRRWVQASATNLFTRVLPFNERKYIQMRRMNCEEYLRLPRRFLWQLYAFCETRGCLLLGRRRLKIVNKKYYCRYNHFGCLQLMRKVSFFFKVCLSLTRESN